MLSSLNRLWGIKGSAELGAQDNHRWFHSSGPLRSWADESDLISYHWDVLHHAEKDNALLSGRFRDRGPAIDLSWLLSCIIWVCTFGMLPAAEALPVQINHRAQTRTHCACRERTRQIGVDTSQRVETNHRQASHTLTSDLDPMLVLRTESAPLSF